MVSTEAMKRLRRANPVPGPLAPPPIGPLLAQLGEPSAADVSAPDAKRGRRWRPALAGIATTAMIVVAIAVTAGALIALHAGRGSHQPAVPSTPRLGALSSREALVNTLGVLRRPQSAADRRVRIPPGLAHRQDESSDVRLGHPDRSLIRIAARTPWGKNVIFIPLKPNRASAVPPLRQERLFVFYGGGGVCCDTAESIHTGGGAGASSSVGRGRIGVVLVLPDGVARISILAHYGHPLTLTAAVHNNVAAFYAPGREQDGMRDTVTWYGPSGNVVKRFTSQAF